MGKFISGSCINRGPDLLVDHQACAVKFEDSVTFAGIPVIVYLGLFRR
jgi:hypothetical protein